MELRRFITYLSIVLPISNTTFALTETEFVQQFTQHHPFFKQQDFILQNNTLAPEIANTYQDWTLATSLTHNDSKNTLINTLAKTHQSGETINITSTLVDNYANNITPYTNNLALSYTIPLLQNKNGINNKLNSDLATIDLDIARLQYNIDRKSFIHSALKKFYQMKFLEHKLDIFNSKQNIEEQQLKLLQEKLESNLVDPADVLLQENNYQSVQINVAETTQELATITQELQNLIKAQALTNDARFNITNIKNGFKQENSSVLRIFDLKEQRYYRELQSLQNQQDPQVDLSIGAEKSQTNTQLFGGRISSDNSINIGLSIALPIGHTTNTNLIKQKQTQIQINKEQKKNKIIELNNSNQSILNQLNSLKKVIQINQKQIKTAKQKVIEFEKMYKNSNTELSFLISARSSQKTFELNYWTNLLQYKKLVLDYQELVL